MIRPISIIYTYYNMSSYMGYIKIHSIYLLRGILL